MTRLFTSVAALLLLIEAHAQTVVHDVIYLKQGGAAFTMDVFEPKTPNGMGVIYMVSGGWSSNHEMLNPGVTKPFLDQGITVFEVVHGSQPRYTVSEIIPIVQRAVRFIHSVAPQYHVDPNRLGVTGISSGGHLTLMLAGTGGPGNPGAPDPVDRESSAVKAVVAFMPPTDFANWGKPGYLSYSAKNLAGFMPAFGINAQTPADKLTSMGHDLSPIYTVTDHFPPTLLIHGDSDTLVPVQQSREMDAELEKHHIKHALVIIPGGGHDGKTIVGGFPAALKWFMDNL